MKYSFKKVEKKWQSYWEENKTFKAKNDYSLPKFFPLVEFPYPSGQGLHVGHPRSYTALDVISRKRRLEGQNVLFCMGFDAFGLPTENFAIKNNIHPKIVTENNINNFKNQLKMLGLSFDWDREINTTDPHYYKWTQWIFIKLFEHGLAYKSNVNVNYCPDCKVVLANEEVVLGKCERCQGDVVRKHKSQWMLKITDYAERLAIDLEKLDYIDKVKTSQYNWIGKSEGIQVQFKSSLGDDILVYTTRADTIFGVSYIAISPEHDILLKWKDKIKNFGEVQNYIKASKNKSDFERGQLVKDKTGVILNGVNAINPANKEAIPIVVADYVLIGYGTGAVMAVPAHDVRDFEFCNKFGLDVKRVIDGDCFLPYSGDENSVIINSDFLNGLSINSAKEKMAKWVIENNVGQVKVNYKLRDWVFARQRYWGEPIPIVICPCCGYVPLNVEDLPLTLPEIDDFKQSSEGDSPLSLASDWLKTSCPSCGKDAVRESDTMPQWAGSSWYYLRYINPDNDKEIVSKKDMEYWMPVDWYNGGMEHTTLHLLYSRFWHKFLYDIGVVNTNEPYLKRTSHGMILGENGEKMSKSRGNVINPDDIIKEYGADALRLYEMFIGDFEKPAVWSSKNIKGCERFLDRVYSLMDILVDGTSFSDSLETPFNKAIKKVSEDIESLKLNTAISALMSLINEIYKNNCINRYELKTFLILLNPFIPHITEEMWQLCNFQDFINQAQWPKYEISKCVDNVINIPVQINGKLKCVLYVSPDISKEEILSLAKSDCKIKEDIKDKNIVKEIYVPKKIVNIVIK